MKLINAKQASEILGIRLPRLYELTRLNAVPFVRIGSKQIRFDPDKLDEWVKRGGTGKNEKSDRAATVESA